MLLSLHDQLIKATSFQQVTYLTRRDLSAAFNTIDQSILLKLLFAWFGITFTALHWMKSYLLNRSFYVNIGNTKSSLFPFLYGVPQGSVLGPLLFILYTTLPHNGCKPFTEAADDCKRWRLTGADWDSFKDLCCCELRLTALEGWNNAFNQFTSTLINIAIKNDTKNLQ
jgi:Reverse transcriptase (RNA-dependent DNA polymerase)